MIKTAGANVTPREVELTVEAVPGVPATFVVGLPDPERGEIVGCLGVRSRATSSIPRDHAPAADQLSSFKIPRRFW